MCLVASENLIEVFQRNIHNKIPCNTYTIIQPLFLQKALIISGDCQYSYFDNTVLFFLELFHIAWSILQLYLILQIYKFQGTTPEVHVNDLKYSLAEAYQSINNEHPHFWPEQSLHFNIGPAFLSQPAQRRQNRKKRDNVLAKLCPHIFIQILHFLQIPECGFDIFYQLGILFTIMEAKL